jgi:hypothetical protein
MTSYLPVLFNDLEEHWYHVENGRYAAGSGEQHAVVESDDGRSRNDVDVVRRTLSHGRRRTSVNGANETARFIAVGEISDR